MGAQLGWTLIIRLERTSTERPVIRPHRPGTLHHMYVIADKLRVGPLSDPADLAAGDFARFPGDVEHIYDCLTDQVVAHMVTTEPQVRQFGPTVSHRD